MARAGVRPSRVADAAALARLLKPGERLFLPGSSGEARAFTAALWSGAAPPLSITGTLAPGINSLPEGDWPDGTIYTSLFALPQPKGAQGEGRLRHLPMSYGAFARRLKAERFDTVVVHVSPPDEHGLCSHGAMVEFLPLVLANAARVFAIVNPRMPRMPRAETFRLADAAAYVELDQPLVPYDTGAPNAEATAIAGHVAGLIEDGATLQVGLGKTPDALMRALADRRGLGIHSGMISDGARILAESGSLDPDFDHTSCVHVGSAAHYDWLRDNPLFSVRSCAQTHDPAALAHLPRLVAVNSALSVDLTGQANLETLNGRGVSGVGGAADFSRAAANAADGISVIALPAAAGRGGPSRILARLEGTVSVPRHDVDVVVTEHGVADLRGLSVLERGERLIDIAAPEHRAALTAAHAEASARL